MKAETPSGPSTAKTSSGERSSSAATARALRSAASRVTPRPLDGGAAALSLCAIEGFQIYNEGIGLSET